jgi:transglutaminase-like putative cysteine protease
MRLRIRHRTTFRYDHPVGYAIQSLRMMPRRHDGQQVEDWSVTVTGRRLPLVGSIDGYGNWVHLHSRNDSHETTEIVVSGLVELGDMGGIVAGADEPLPAFFYLRQTALTRPDAELQAIAADVPAGRDPLDRLDRLMAAIDDRIACRPGGDERLSASQVLAAGRGGCQDIAHVMLACARQLGFPARYVSGYLHAGDDAAPREAGHAWAEVHVPNRGWVGLDPTLQARIGDRHVRVAVGLDYWSAAQVRGVWRGQAEQAQTVTVQVAAAEMTQ